MPPISAESLLGDGTAPFEVVGGNSTTAVCDAVDVGSGAVIDSTVVESESVDVESEGAVVGVVVAAVEGAVEDAVRGVGLGVGGMVVGGAGVGAAVGRTVHDKAASDGQHVMSSHRVMQFVSGGSEAAVPLVKMQVPGFELSFATVPCSRFWSSRRVCKPLKPVIARPMVPVTLVRRMSSSYKSVMPARKSSVSLASMSERWRLRNRVRPLRTLRLPRTFKKRNK